MNWTKWKIGAGIALLCALFTAGAGLSDPNMGWRGFLSVFCAACLTNFLTYLAKHPIENISILADGHSASRRGEVGEEDGSRVRSPHHVPLWFFVAALAAVAIHASGCASFKTKQEDTSYDAETGNKVRKITTFAKSSTLFDSKSQLANFKATQTDKTQSASVGSLSQEANTTNVVNMIEAATRGAVSGALKK
jgi:hypothetical protein